MYLRLDLTYIANRRSKKHCGILAIETRHDESKVIIGTSTFGDDSRRGHYKQYIIHINLIWNVHFSVEATFSFLKIHNFERCFLYNLQANNDR